MGTRSFFEDVSNPQVMVQIGKAGDSGIIQISDILFTVKGPTAGAILMEWNVYETTQGSVAMWDSHFRVGGAMGTNLQLADCPVFASFVNTNCMAAFMLLHVTSEASGYFDNVWAWTADHDLDNPLNTDASESNEGIPVNVQTDISIYSGRGILIELQDPAWFYGSSSEHPNQNALSPYTSGEFPSDPTFENCADDLCRGAWALQVIESTNIFIYSAGFYSFFQNNALGCTLEEECQLALIDTNFDNGLWIYNIFTKGNIQIISPEGGIPPVLFNSTTSDGYTSEVAAWLVLSTGGNTTGDSGGGSGIVTIDPIIWGEGAPTIACIPPCTYVLPPLTLSKPTTFNFPPLVTPITIGWYSSTTGLDFGETLTQSFYHTTVETTTITIPVVTTTVISWFDVTVVSNSTIIFPFPSIVPPGFNITDPTVIGGTTNPPNTRTFYPPPWPGSDVPPILTTPPTSTGTSTTNPPGSNTPSTVLPGTITSVHHTRGAPKPTCTEILGCGHHCVDSLFVICSPGWLFCPGSVGMDGTDTNEPDCDPFPENGPEPEPEPSSSECETSTFSSCNNIYTPTAATSTCSMVCEEVVGCETTSGFSSCLAPDLTSYLWTPTGAMPLPTLGDGGPGFMFGYTYLTGSEFTSVPPLTGSNPTVTSTSSISITSTPSPKSTTPAPTTTTSIPPTSTTTTIYPTNTAENVGSAFCFSATNGNFVEFTLDDAMNVIAAFCAGDHVLGPGNTFGFAEGDADGPNTIFATAMWATDQTGCGSEADFSFSSGSFGCLEGWDTDYFCEDEDGSSSSDPPTSFGGAYVLKPPHAGGCILISLFAMPTSNSKREEFEIGMGSLLPGGFNSSAEANLTALRGHGKTTGMGMWPVSDNPSEMNGRHLFNQSMLALLINGTVMG